jgi:hypothetical protein
MQEYFNRRKVNRFNSFCQQIKGQAGKVFVKCKTRMIKNA